MQRCTLLLSLAAFAFAWTAPTLTATAEEAAVRISARLVAASNRPPREKPAPASADLADVLPLVQENLRFTSYELVCKRTFPVVDGMRVKLDRDLTLLMSEVKRRQCTVQVERRARALVTTRLRFEPGHPVVLGGFPDTDGTTLVIVLAAE